MLNQNIETGIISGTIRRLQAVSRNDKIIDQLIGRCNMINSGGTRLVSFVLYADKGILTIDVMNGSPKQKTHIVEMLKDSPLIFIEQN